MEPPKPARRGFLPFPTNWFDRLFIGVVCYVAIVLLWLRFVEEFASVWIAVAAGIAWTAYLIRKG